MNLYTLFEAATDKKASDIHLASESVPCLRIDGALVRFESDLLSHQDLVRFVEPAFGREHLAKVDAGIAVENSLVHNGITFVGIAFRCGGGRLAVTFRLLTNTIPSLEQVGDGALPLFEKITGSPRGLALVTGPTGSGKWTVACSIVDAINIQKPPSRIFVLENHPSYIIESKSALVSQIHVGQDVDTYAHGLEIAMQADPDVIACADVPTLEALRQMLILADTGHLVIANLHAVSVVDALQRLCDSAGAEAPALLRSLAQNMVAIVSQRLMPRSDRSGRVAAFEWITPTEPIRSALLGGDLVEIARLQDLDPECRTMDQALKEMLAGNVISPETADRYRS